ncbi:MAG TPA: hypothetical protein VH985_24565, partial [Candidatus Binatia bacterium]
EVRRRLPGHLTRFLVQLLQLATQFIEFFNDLPVVSLDVFPRQFIHLFLYLFTRHLFKTTVPDPLAPKTPMLADQCDEIVTLR